MVVQNFNLLYGDEEIFVDLVVVGVLGAFTLFGGWNFFEILVRTKRVVI